MHGPDLIIFYCADCGGLRAFPEDEPGYCCNIQVRRVEKDGDPITIQVQPSRY